MDYYVIRLLDARSKAFAGFLRFNGKPTPKKADAARFERKKADDEVNLISARGKYLAAKVKE